MDPAREKTLVSLLNELDVSGVTFPAAKQQLLAKGYSEAEIVYALYSAPFDGKVNEPVAENPLHEFYRNNPARANKVAQLLFYEDALEDKDRVLALATAAQAAPDTHSQAYYDVRLADELGIPYFTIFGIALLLLVLGFTFDIPNPTIDIVLKIFGLCINILIYYKIFKKLYRVHKLRKAVHQASSE
jgi:hypothetical protein